MLISRSQARSNHGVANLWNAALGRKAKVNTHEAFEEKIRELAREQPAALGVFNTMLDETPAIPVAMAMGSSPTFNPTYQQKYPLPLNRVLVALVAEIEAALDDRS